MKWDFVCLSLCVTLEAAFDWGRQIAAHQATATNFIFCWRSITDTTKNMWANTRFWNSSTMLIFLTRRLSVQINFDASHNVKSSGDNLQEIQIRTMNRTWDKSEKRRETPSCDVDENLTMNRDSSARRRGRKQHNEQKKNTKKKTSPVSRC